MTNELAEKLEAWSNALKDTSNRTLTVDYLSQVNGECITVAIDEAAQALRSHAAQSAVGRLSQEEIDALLAYQAPSILAAPVVYITHEQLCMLACEWAYSLEEAWDTAHMAFKAVGIELAAAPQEPK
jgi:NADH/NAD ratio-sensing transcriptional regulator Rex